jgi:hypothetical protein
VVVERTDRVLVLRGQMERLTARREELQQRRRGEEIRQLVGRREQMLEVVEHDERLRTAKVIGEITARARRLLDGGHDQPGIAQRLQRDPVDAAREVGLDVVRELEREPRLARAARSGERDEPVPGQKRGCLTKLTPAADEGRRRHGQVCRLARGCRQRRSGERRVMVEDRLLERLQLGTRIESELVAQRRPQLAVDAQSVRLAARTIVGEHQLRAEALAKWMLGGELLQLGHELAMATAGEICLDPVAERVETHFVEPLHLVAPRRLERASVQGRPTPQRERLAQPDRGGRGRQCSRAVGQTSELGRVQVSVGDRKHVPGRPRHDCVRPERPP